MTEETTTTPIGRSRSRKNIDARRQLRDGRPVVPGQLLPVDHAAEYLGISPGTLRNWISARRIEYVKVGRLTRIARAAIDRYIAENTVRAVDGDERL